MVRRKENKVIIKIIALLAGLLNLLGFGFSGGGFYTIDATTVESRDGIVIFEDDDGNVWEAYGDFSGDSVVLVMNNHGTPEIEDDEIAGFWRQK